MFTAIQGFEKRALQRLREMGIKYVPPTYNPKAKMNRDHAQSLMKEFNLHEKYRKKRNAGNMSARDAQAADEADMQYSNAVALLEHDTGIDNGEIYDYMYKHHAKSP